MTGNVSIPQISNESLYQTYGSTYRNKSTRNRTEKTGYPEITPNSLPLNEKDWIPNYCISPIVIKDISGFWGVK